jgi:hypothetical protein
MSVLLLQCNMCDVWLFFCLLPGKQMHDIHFVYHSYCVLRSICRRQRKICVQFCTLLLYDKAKNVYFFLDLNKLYLSSFVYFMNVSFQFGFPLSFMIVCEDSNCVPTRVDTRVQSLFFFHFASYRMLYEMKITIITNRHFYIKGLFRVHIKRLIFFDSTHNNQTKWIKNVRT